MIVINAVHGLPIVTNARIASGVGYVLPVVYLIKIANIAGSAKARIVTVPSVADIRPKLYKSLMSNEVQ